MYVVVYFAIGNRVAFTQPFAHNFGPNKCQNLRQLKPRSTQLMPTFSWTAEYIIASVSLRFFSTCTRRSHVAEVISIMRRNVSGSSSAALIVRYLVMAASILCWICSATAGSPPLARASLYERTVQKVAPRLREIARCLRHRLKRRGITQPWGHLLNIPVEFLRPVKLLVQLDELLLDDAEAEVEALVGQEENVRYEVEARRVRLSLTLALRRRRGYETGLLRDVPSVF